MVGWHHRLDGLEFKQTLGDGKGQGSLACCSPWIRVGHSWVTEQQQHRILNIVPCVYIHMHACACTHTHTHTHSRTLLVINFVNNSLYLLLINSKFVPLPFFPFGNYKFVFYACESLCSVNKFICIIFLGSTYKWYHTIFGYLSFSNLVHLIW